MAIVRPDDVAATADKALAELLRSQAESLFLSALEFGHELRFWFDKALENGVDVWSVLEGVVRHRASPSGRVENAVRLLGSLSGERAEELLKAASERDEVSGLAQKTLERKSRRDRSVEEGMLPSGLQGGLKEEDWEILLRRIQRGRCVPVLGAGLNYEFLPRASDIAREWAAFANYPFEGADDLARVAQYLAVQTDPMVPKEKIAETFKGIGPPNFGEPGEPHAVLAELPLSVYITTNYDNFMTQALRSRGRDARKLYYRWNDYLERERDIEPDVFPTPPNPVVFHFHGIAEVPPSLVLTEDDYLDFLQSTFTERAPIPRRIEEALAAEMLLFIGYRMRDWDFRILLRVLQRYMNRQKHLAVTLSPPRDEGAQHMEMYYRRLGIRIYWGTAWEFLGELRQRREAFSQ